MNNELIIPSVDNSEVLVRRTSELLNDQAGEWYFLPFTLMNFYVGFRV